MKKENDLLDRMIALEKEVLDLRSEVQHLKQHVKLDPIKPMKEELTPTFVSSIKQKQEAAPVRVVAPET